MSDELEKTQVVSGDAAGQKIPADDGAGKAGNLPEPEPHGGEVDPRMQRLKAEAAEYRRRLRELEQKVKADEDAKLSEAERLQRRLAELERRNAEYEQMLQSRVLEYEIKLQASRLQIADPDDAFRLIDVAAVEFDDDGKPKNVEPLLRELIARKPYLVGGRVSVSPTNPAQGRVVGGSFTRSQLRDPKFFQENREAIMTALREGKILDD